VVFWFVDPLGPNWEVAERRMSPTLVHLSLRKKRFATGGDGEPPQIVRRSDDGLSREVPAARWWSAILAAITAALAVAVGMHAPQLQWVVVFGLVLFGIAFAVNSSVHSYLVLAYAGSEKAAEDVGFYYAANALGRFGGTLLSGLLYQWGGLLWALIASAMMLTACWLVTLALPVVRPKA
jgi:MFS family permease